jgi:hypothetical protein
MGARRARLGGRQGCLSEARRYAIICRACGACLHLRNACTAPGSSSLGHLSSCPRDDHQCVFRSGGGPLSLDRTRTRNSSIPAGLDPVRLRRRGTRNCDFPKHCALPAVALGCRFGDVKSLCSCWRARPWLRQLFWHTLHSHITCFAGRRRSGDGNHEQAAKVLAVVRGALSGVDCDPRGCIHIHSIRSSTRFAVKRLNNAARG